MSSNNRTVNLSSGDVLSYSLMKDGIYLNAEDYPVEEVMNILNSSMIHPKIRIFVLYNDETLNYQIPSEDILDNGNFSENYQQGQRRSLSFSLYNEDGRYSPNINNFWVGTRLKLELGVETASGVDIWFKKGVFIISNINRVFDNNQSIVTIEAKDKFGIFEENSGKLESTYEIPQGNDIREIISQILLQDMGNGCPFDPQPIIYHYIFEGKKTQCPISKSAGDSYGSILSDLASQLSAEIFYNAEGRLTIIPSAEAIQDTQKTLLYHFNQADCNIASLNINFNLSAVINQIIVIGSSNKGGVYRAVARNESATSPLSIQRIGVRTGDIINDSNIISTYTAQERANYELRKQLILQTTLNANVTYNPLIEINNIVAFSSEELDLRHERFILQSISCPLNYEGQMTITVSNIRNLPLDYKN